MKNGDVNPTFQSTLAFLSHRQRKCMEFSPIPQNSTKFLNHQLNASFSIPILVFSETSRSLQLSVAFI